MSLWDVIILAAVQGLTEFLPISSSGHLVVARQWFGISDIEGGAVDAFLHLGTLIAVIWYYRRQLITMGRGLVKHTTYPQTSSVSLTHLVIATIPAAMIGWLGYDYFTTSLRSTTVLMAGFMLTAVLLLWGEIWSRRISAAKLITLGDAWWIGLSQILALVPSISRSGITMATGLTRRLSRQQAVDFSFLMSIPIIAGAGLKGLVELQGTAILPWAHLVVALLVSFGCGYLAIDMTLKIVKRISFMPFVGYLLVLSVVVWYAG